MGTNNESTIEFTIEMSNEKTAREWTDAGDNEKSKDHNATAIGLYIKALGYADPIQTRYLIPRVMACYRRQNKPIQAKDFLLKMVYTHGIDVMDHVTYTVMASIHGDLKEWDQALECANRACALNEGEIDEYLNAVYNRINYNMNAEKGNLVFA